MDASSPTPASTDTLVRIDAPHFCAGVVISGGVVTRAAPILKYMFGWTGARVGVYAIGKGWTVDYKLPGCEWARLSPRASPARP
jgi:hypothetical protein